jgi:hypothetical protein
MPRLADTEDPRAHQDDWINTPTACGPRAHTVATS